MDIIALAERLIDETRTVKTAAAVVTEAPSLHPVVRFLKQAAETLRSMPDEPTTNVEDVAKLAFTHYIAGALGGLDGADPAAATKGGLLGAGQATLTGPIGGLGGGVVGGLAGAGLGALVGLPFGLAPQTGLAGAMLGAGTGSMYGGHALPYYAGKALAERYAGPPPGDEKLASAVTGGAVTGGGSPAGIAAPKLPGLQASNLGATAGGGGTSGAYVKAASVANTIRKVAADLRALGDGESSDKTAAHVLNAATAMSLLIPSKEPH